MNRKPFLKIYILPLLALLSYAFIFTSCSKEDAVEPLGQGTSSYSSLSRSEDLPELFGFYASPSRLKIGNMVSEDKILEYLKKKGGNMMNCYARNSMATSSGRAKFAAFCRKALSSYGVRLITCDVREVSELATWEAFYTSYPDLRNVVCPLTEKEPWVTGDYTGCFALLRETRAMCNRYGAKFYFYEGWMGKNYVNPQAAVDSMVFYSDGIFLSNYVSTADYLSTQNGYGKWDNRIKFRLDQGTSNYGGITVAAKRFNKRDYPIVELQSLEYNFLFDIYSFRDQNHSFYGSLYEDAKELYGRMSEDVLKYTDLKGKSLFHLDFVAQAQPN